MTLCFGGLASSGRVDGGDTSDPPTLVSCRKGEAWRSDRLLLNKEVLSPQAVESFVPLLSAVGEDFVRRARAQVGQSGRERWTADFTHELFRFALECEYWGTFFPPHRTPLAGCPRWPMCCVSPSFILRDGPTSFFTKAVCLEGCSLARQIENNPTLFYHLLVTNPNHQGMSP